MSADSEAARANIDGLIVARMIMQFHEAMRGTYPEEVMMSSLCAVGPLQTMIGLGIKNGWLKVAADSHGIPVKALEAGAPDGFPYS
jgi:hypothetical protein